MLSLLLSQMRLGIWMIIITVILFWLGFLAYYYSNYKVSFNYLLFIPLLDLFYLVYLYNQSGTNAVAVETFITPELMKRDCVNGGSQKSPISRQKTTTRH